MDAEFAHDTNVNRAPVDSEEQSDNALALEAYAARSFLLSARSGVVVRGGLKLTQYLEFGDLSSFGFTGHAAWRFQPRLGYGSPWIELAADIEGFKHNDSEIRDGHVVSLSASIGKYFSDRIRVAASAGIEERDAYEGEVFQQSNWKVRGTLDYKLTARTTLYGSATWMDGEQAFTLFDTAGHPNLFTWATASASDPAFASAFGGVAPTAYRIDAQTTLLDLGANFALTGSQAIDLGVLFFESEPDRGSGTYSGATARISYMYRF